MKHSPKIVIVEDDLNKHPLYRDAFSAAGFEVVICQTADGFFPEEVSDIKPDIISMDLMIGKDGKPTERDGFEAIEALRFDLRTVDIPIFVLSNFSSDEKVLRAMALGVVDYISASGESLPKIAERYKQYLENPKHYKHSHPIFRER